MTATIDHDRPTLGESYGIATTTSNLRVDLERRTPADLILAAGMLPKEHRLGVLLLRLRAEHDGVVSEIQHADEFGRQREHEAAKAAKITKDANGEPFDGMSLAKAIRKRSHQEVMTARVIALGKLGTLDEAVLAVGAFACIQATKLRFMKSDQVARKIAGRVIDVWLDPLCSHCDGTTLEGSAYRGEKVTPCRHCNATGHRRTQVGSDDADRAFAWALLLQIDRAAGQAASRMRHILAAD